MAENSYVVQVVSWQIAKTAKMRFSLKNVVYEHFYKKIAIVYYLVLTIITPNFIILGLTVR